MVDTIGHVEFTRRPLARSEVRALARRLGYPRCQYRGGHLEGAEAWQQAALSAASDRRDLYTQLLTFEHRNRQETRR